MYDYNYGYETAATGLGTGYLVTIFIIAVLSIVAMWKIYTKAGKPGWASIIPLYNMYTLFEIAGMNGWMFLLMCVPIVNIVIMFVLYINLAKAFGKSAGFGLGLIFLNTIFILILGFGSAEYIGNQN